MSRKLAVIRDAEFRYDYGEPAVTFTTYTEESLAALQVLTPEQSRALLIAYQPRQLSDLNGKTVWIQHSAEGSFVLGKSVYDGPANLGGKP